MGSDMEDPFHSSHWETFSARRSTIKALPRPEEDYQTALKELIDAATKVSNLFDEIYPFCHKNNPTESNLDPVNLSKSILPADVMRSGQAYQKLVPESFQVIQKLADKVSACAFSQDPSDTTRASDNATSYFHKIIDYGMFQFQSDLLFHGIYCIHMCHMRVFVCLPSRILSTSTSFATGQVSICLVTA
jgi:hypothetical protein